MELALCLTFRCTYASTFSVPAYLLQQLDFPNFAKNQMDAFNALLYGEVVMLTAGFLDVTGRLA